MIIKTEEFLDLQFGYTNYYGSEPRLGWLLNYHTFKDHLSCWMVTMYFVDEYSNNFKTTCRYYPSLILEFKEDLANIEEFLKKKYEGLLQGIETVQKINIEEYNHLNKAPQNYLKLYFTSENNFQYCHKDLKDMLRDSTDDRFTNRIYNDFCNETHNENISYQILKIHEYDIPIEVQISKFFDVHCGKWYNVCYRGEKYIFEKNDRITHPDLKIFAFDIETTKPPLKFPNPEFDQVMMISILTEEFGELIVNRKIVSKDIQEFEYTAKEEIGGSFRISNEKDEESLLIRFIEIIQAHKPHIITTYNGGFFDWPFIEKRMMKYGMDLNKTTQFVGSNEYYECPFIIHIDCYKWVKRDSYLPMNNQGLKDVTRIKLGYYPDEIDPEDMVRFAYEDPQKLASYSVSDAVATFFLYFKFVHPHIYSVCTLIPLPPVQTLCKGSGTLCEALLITEASKYNMFIPPKKKYSGLQYYNGHIIENLTYVGGYVASLKAGIYRSDFDSEFKINPDTITMIIENLDDILLEFVDCLDYHDRKIEYIESLEKIKNITVSKGAIYHLDVGAMYPNIILTNRLQPISVVNEDICVRCDYNDKNNQCKKKMDWVSRVEYIPPEKNEIFMIKTQLEHENFLIYENGSSKKVNFLNLTKFKQDELLRERVLEYSRNIYKKAKKTEEKRQKITICQREIPFYVETVRKFRDQRYFYKDLYKNALSEYEKDKNNENKKKLIAYSSIQVAYKCILNSFYGYVMREGSRWHSLEMAATVTNLGSEIIKLTKNFIEGIGVPLELDTDGIWCLIPKDFPTKMEINGNKIDMLAILLNYFVCKKFTNYNYQTKINGKYEINSENTIFFEVDGPYKSMIIPSSTEENKLLKKRYVVFDKDNKTVELKGFELKRRGELNFIKKFQEDIFNHFNDGNTLQECYNSLAQVCNYWLDIIYNKGIDLDEDSLFYLFSESRNMSKSLECYGNKKSNIVSTAKKLSEFLGPEILDEKLKCEFIISKYPLNAPTADRAIPVMIFKDKEKNTFLKKWLKSSKILSLNEIIDWDYYRIRFENILQRLIVIPAFLQNIKNPIERITVTAWVNEKSRTERLSFNKVLDIEDLSKKRKIDDIFYTKSFRSNHVSDSKDEFPDQGSLKIEIPKENIEQIDTSKENKKLMDFKNLFSYAKSIFVCFYKKKIGFDKIVISIKRSGSDMVSFAYLNNCEVTKKICRNIYLEIDLTKHFESQNKVVKYLTSAQNIINFVEMSVSEDEVKSELFLKFLDHFSIKKVHCFANPIYQILADNPVLACNLSPIYISSFNYQKKPVFCITNLETIFISEIKHPIIQKISLNDYKEKELRSLNVVVFSKYDVNLASIIKDFDGFYCISTDFVPHIALGSFDNLMKTQMNMHLNLKKRFQQILDISNFSKIPLLNIGNYLSNENGVFELLDCMLYKEFMANDILPVEDNNFLHNIIKEESCQKGFYSGFCVQFECFNSLILSIIEYRSFQENYLQYDGFYRKDFIVLRDFVKNLVIKALKNDFGSKYLLDKISKWIKKDSKMICSELKEILELNHQKYLINLISKLKQEQFKIVCVSKELFIIATDKYNQEGCDQIIQYIKKKVSEFSGYELLNFRPLKIYEKLAIVDINNIFYFDNKKVIDMSDTKLPFSFLESYFLENDIHNDVIYDLAPRVCLKTLKIILKLLSFRRDVHGLASNCYKLIRANEFNDSKNPDFNINIFCNNCGIENFVRRKCLKCYKEFDNTLIENECINYLYFCWKNQVSGDFYCNKCGLCNEKRLKEYCKCGGKFEKKDYIQEILNLREFVSTKSFDEKVQTIIKYFE